MVSIARFEKVRERWQERIRNLPGAFARSWLIVVSFLVVFAATNLISYFAFSHTPHVADSAAYIFQAKTFSKGLLYGLLPQPLMFFMGGALHMTVGKWYSLYPPGHALVLAPWTALGIPWISNPLLGALSVVFIFFYGRSYYDKGIGTISMLLAAVSPVIIFMSSEFMSHATCMFFVLVFALLFRKSLSSGRIVYYALTGLALGMVVLTRPYTGLAVSIPFIFRLLYVRIIRRPRSWGGVVAFGLALSVMGGLYMAYNALTNGHPLKFGHMVVSDRVDLRLGFGEREYQYDGKHVEYTAAEGLTRIPFFAGLFCKQLHGWPVPDLVFVALLFLMFRRTKPEDFFQLSVFLSLAVAHVFFWYVDDVFGPRYVYESTPMLIVLSARGISETYGVLKSHWPMRGKGARLPAAIMLAVIGGFTIFSFLKTFPRLYDKYSHNYIGARCTVCEAVRRMNIHNAVVLIRSNNVDYVTNMIMYLNSPLLDTDVIYARDWGESNALIMQQYPERAFYVHDVFFAGSWDRSEIAYVNTEMLRPEPAGGREQP